MKRLILYTIMLFAVAQYSNIVQQSLAAGGGQNHPPSVTNLVILPSLPYETENLFVHYNYFDEDGDIEEGSKIAWYKNGIGITEFYNKNMVPSSATSAGERWYFTITPKDGKEFGKVQHSEEVIIFHCCILPSSPYETANLFAHYGYLEENRSVEYSDIRWYKNGILQSILNDENVVPSSATSPGEQWYFTIKSKNEQESREIQSERTTILPYSYAVFPHDTGPVNKWKLPKDAIMRLGKGSVTDMNYSPDGKYLAVSSEIGVWIYDTHSNWKEVTFLLSDLSSPVYSITFSPDGRIYNTPQKLDSMLRWISTCHL
jgi:WD40 repeat protein